MNSRDRLRDVDDTTLHEDNLRLAKEERELGTTIIENLQETQLRRLYAKLGYSSMHGYLTKELKYSSQMAQNRLDALVLTSDFPETVEALEKGIITLAQANVVQKFARAELKATGNEIALEVKKELIEKIKNKTSQETEAILVKEFPKAAALTAVQLSNQATQAIKRAHRADEAIHDLALSEWIRLTPQLQAQLDLFVTLSADLDSANGFPITQNIEVESRLEHALKMINKTLQEKIERKLKHNIVAATLADVPVQSEGQTGGHSAASNWTTQSNKRPYIPVDVRREVHKRAGNRCEYVSNVNKLRCSETKHLEVDHIQALAKNGANHIDNFQLLCSSHNKYKAIVDLGSEQMGKYLKLAGS